MSTKAGLWADNEKIKVAIRKRPMSKPELRRNYSDIVAAQQNSTISIAEQKFTVDTTPYQEQHDFYFDYVFDEHADNQDVFRTSVQPMLRGLLRDDGWDTVTVFAYGETGSGKSYTMIGDDKSGVQGLYELAMAELLELVNTKLGPDFKVCMSYFEIYGNKLFDLQNQRTELKCFEDSEATIRIPGLQECTFETIEEFRALLRVANECRRTGSNKRNYTSSRSHAILQVAVVDEVNSEDWGEVLFIDLAGSERAADSMDQSKNTKHEGAEINKSLLALKECIRAQDQNQSHIPFRTSKLTRVLKPSFLGNCVTLMIATVSPSSHSCEQTLNTLRYSDRFKYIQKPNQTGKSVKNPYMPHLKSPYKSPRPASTPRRVPSGSKPKSGARKSTPHRRSGVSAATVSEGNRPTPPSFRQGLFKETKKQTFEDLKGLHHGLMEETMKIMKIGCDLWNGDHTHREYISRLGYLLDKQQTAIDSVREHMDPN